MMSLRGLNHDDRATIAEPACGRDGRRALGLMLGKHGSRSRSALTQQRGGRRPEFKDLSAALEQAEGNPVFDAEYRNGAEPTYAVTHCHFPRCHRETRRGTSWVNPVGDGNATYVSARCGPISLFSRRSALETILAGGLPVGALA